MVSGDNFSDEVLKSRPVLGDLTNQPGKRGFSSISADSTYKSGHGYHRDDGDSQFAKQVCLGVENLVKEKCNSKFGINSDHNILPLQKGKEASGQLPVCGGVDGSRQNVSSDNASQQNHQRERYNLSNGSVQIVRGNSRNMMEVGDKARHSGASSVSVPTSSRTFTVNSCGFGGRLTSSVSQDRPLSEGLATHTCESDARHLRAGKLASPKCGGIAWSSLSGSHDSESPVLERCGGLKGDGGANLVAGDDLLKACFCAFCSKAAYIWSDLHYQDIKGRLAALKKSHKEASMLAQKISGAKETIIQGQGDSNESAKMESYLMDQWRSLFVYMEKTLAHESSQLTSDFDALKDLKESCKNDLETIDRDHSDNY